MRLLHTGTYKLVSFIDHEAPDYAILSHKWRDNEVQFHNLEDAIKTKPKELMKIQHCCTKALGDSINYVWIDTCCIDKSSSTELSEAINSMYRWYQQAKVCYVYLDDVVFREDIEKSVWLTRGWTLQEMLAPAHMVFFNEKWQTLGSKNQLSNELSLHTGIPQNALRRFQPSKYPVAQRMSWASRRETTRIEDRAYSLLGIFQVNMTLNYGETDQAFLRLQRHIIESFDDQSLLIWSGVSNSMYPFLAASPDGFEKSNGITQSREEEREQRILDFESSLETGDVFVQSDSSLIPKAECGREIDYEDQCEKKGLVYDGFSLSNAGMTIKLFLIPYFPDVYIAVLRRCACLTTEDEHVGSHDFVPQVGDEVNGRTSSKAYTSNTVYNHNVGIFLRRSSSNATYRRVSVQGKSWIAGIEGSQQTYGQIRNVHISRFKPSSEDRDEHSYRIRIGEIQDWWHSEIVEALTDKVSFAGIMPKSSDQNQAQILYRQPTPPLDMTFAMRAREIGVTVMIHLTSQRQSPVLIHLGFDFHFSAFCLMSVLNRPAVKLDKNPNRWNLFLGDGHHRYNATSSDSVMEFVKEIRRDDAVRSSAQEQGIRLFTASRHARRNEPISLGKKLWVHFDHDTTGFYFTLLRKTAGYMRVADRHEQVHSPTSQNWRVIAVERGKVVKGGS